MPLLIVPFERQRSAQLPERCYEQRSGTGKWLIDAYTIRIAPKFEAPDDMFGHLPRRAVCTERRTRFRCNEGVLVDKCEVIGRDITEINAGADALPYCCQSRAIAL